MTTPAALKHRRRVAPDIRLNSETPFHSETKSPVLNYLLESSGPRFDCLQPFTTWHFSFFFWRPTCTSHRRKRGPDGSPATLFLTGKRGALTRLSCCRRRFPLSSPPDWEPMTPADLNQLTAEWNAARILYPTYSALAREFVIDLTPCNDLEAGIAQPPQESVEQATRWLNEMDERIQIHQLRQFLQTTTLVTPQLLQTLLLHHLHKDEKSPADRDKIDFLLVQLFSLAAPSRLEDSAVTLEYVARTLSPVLGTD